MFIVFPAKEYLFNDPCVGIYHQVSPKHLQRYCDEFAARYNTRKIADNERFALSVKNAEGRLKYNKLIGKEWN